MTICHPAVTKRVLIRCRLLGVLHHRNSCPRNAWLPRRRKRCAKHGQSRTPISVLLKSTQRRRNMRTLVILALGLTPASAQSPLVRVVNLSHPFSREFQIGDRFEIQIAGAPRQSISVRTVRQGQSDWSPVIASTDTSGRWSTTGQFEKADFGGWSEIWTVGGKLATPAIQFDVNAPCLPGGRQWVALSGLQHGHDMRYG